MENFLKGIISKLACSCLVCKNEISTAFGSVFLSFRAMGIKALVLVTRPRLCFCYYELQTRSLAVLSGSGGSVLNKINVAPCLYSSSRQMCLMWQASVFTPYSELYSY